MLFIGPHVSSSVSVSLSPIRAKEFGATGFALFTKNQRQWSSPPLKEEDVSLFKKNVKELGFSYGSILPHAGYLINPATPSEELREKSLKLFIDEGERVEKLGINILNIHPGAYKEGEKSLGIKRSADMINSVLERCTLFRLAIENTSGSGTIIGSTFEELEELYSSIKYKDRVGFTLDTAHLYGAGYDVKDDVGKVLDSFFSIFGKGKLYGMHLNDSKVELSSHKDRHDNLGYGLIGKEVFLEIVKRKEVENIPLILETPNEELWRNEISMLLGEKK